MAGEQQSITIEDVVIYKEDLDEGVARDVFDTLVNLSSEQRKINMQMMNVNFSIGGFSNTLIGLMNAESESITTATEEESEDS